MKHIVLAVAVSVALSACRPGVQIAGLPHALDHFEACHRDKPHPDCFTVVPEYCKNRRGDTWANYRHWASWDGESGAGTLLLRGEDAAEFLRKFGGAERIGPFPADSEAEIFKSGEEYASKRADVYVASQGCFVKGMVDVWWDIESIKPHLSHIPHKDLPAFLR